MYQIEMSLVFIRILREDEDVVDVHPYKDPQVVSKDIIHDALERRLRITEAKGHNSPPKAPNCVVKAVFSISSSWIRIWWNPLTRSIFENTVEPPSVLKMDWIDGKGYRSRTVRVFDAR